LRLEVDFAPPPGLLDDEEVVSDWDLAMDAWFDLVPGHARHGVASFLCTPLPERGALARYEHLREGIAWFLACDSVAQEAMAMAWEALEEATAERQ